MAARKAAGTDRSQAAKAETEGVERNVKPVARTPATAAVAAAPRPSRGAVDAPGKRHRKPPPQERLDKRMGEPVGKKMGQKGEKRPARGTRR